MRRLPWAIVLLTAACAAPAPSSRPVSPDPSSVVPEPSLEQAASTSFVPFPAPSAITVTVSVHCGLDDARVSLPNGRIYRFDVPDEGNAPEGGGRNEQAISVWADDGDVIAMGPDGVRHVLVLTDRTPPGACF